MDFSNLDIDHIPLVAPIPPETSNFIDPQTLAPAIIAVSVVSLALMLPVAVVRVYVKTWIMKSVWWDDGTCALAIIGAVAYIGLSLASLDVIARHGWDVPVSAFTTAEAQRQILGFEISYGPTTFFAKASLLLLYLRIFTVKPVVRFAIQAGLWVNFVFYLATSIAFVVWCIPRKHESWIVDVSGPRCRHSEVMSYAQGIFGVVSDIYIFILPMPIVWTLHLPLQKKAGIALIFATGFLACVSSILGCWLRILSVRSRDLTYGLGQGIIAAIAETNAGVICACAPSVATLLRRHHPHISSSLAKIKARFSKRSSSSEEGFNRVTSSHSHDIRLETKILGSAARAEGGFMKSRDVPDEEWSSAEGQVSNQV